jgi:hypothetical protein
MSKMQNIIVEPTAIQTTKTYFSLNITGVDEIFQGFMLGDFAVLYGSPSVNALTSLICIRAQLPPQLGGLGSNVVFIDGGITFRLYNIARLAQLHQLNPEKALEKIFISRAFTAYQLTSLVMEKLEETVKAYDAKVVIISDIAGFFLDTDVAAEEAQRIYNQILAYLADFARKHQIIVIATYLPHENSKSNTTLQEMTCANASTVLYFTKTLYGKHVVLEKHPIYILSSTKLPSETTTLTDFMGGNLGQDS